MLRCVGRHLLMQVISDGVTESCLWDFRWGLFPGSTGAGEDALTDVAQIDVLYDYGLSIMLSGTDRFLIFISTGV